jgi:putative peptidoglycan lipid II flippase
MLQGHNHFLLPVVLAPIFQDIGLLIGIIIFTEWWGIYGLAWGTVFGALLHIGVQIPGLFIFKARWSFSLGWNDPRLREVVRLMLPRMIASAVFTINFAAMTNIASRFGDGGISSFEFGLRIMDIPEALIGTALGIVVFPTLAALTELGKFEDRYRVFSDALRFVLVATIPAAAGMILIGHPAVDILFTNPSESALVYASVQVFAFAMILQAVHEIIARAFYAQKDTITPLIASVAGLVGNFIILIIAFTLYRNVDFIPRSSPFGVGIPAIGYLVAFIVELGWLIIVLKRRWGTLDEERVLDVIKRTLIATIFMAIPVLIVDTVLTQAIFTDGGRVAGIIRAGMGGLLGLIFFAVGAYLFNIKEVKQFPAMMRRQLFKQAEQDAASSV